MGFKRPLRHRSNKTRLGGCEHRSQTSKTKADSQLPIRSHVNECLQCLLDILGKMTLRWLPGQESNSKYLRTEHADPVETMQLGQIGAGDLL